MVKDNNARKICIKEVLGKRNYLSYRTDLMLYKTILSLIVFIAIYLLTVDLILSILIAVQVFAIFTLINKLNITRMKGEGEEKLILGKKKDYLQNKLNEMNNGDFEMLASYIFEREGWKNLIKKGSHMYLAEKAGIIYCIKIFKMHEELEVEKIDVRSMISYMNQNNIRKGILVNTGSISENAQELIEKFKDKLEINVIHLYGLMKLLEKYKILPDNKYFYNKICEVEKTVSRKTIVKNNIFDNKKILMYVLAAFFFYCSSRILNNIVIKYIFYYFFILTAVSFVHYLFKRHENDFNQ
ncbi:MAG: restriction endonuclease [Sedimentibacter sp.]